MKKEQESTINDNKADTLPALIASGFAPVNGLDMYYEIYGNGTPLVLIHGGGSTIKSNFGNILPFLVNDFKCIAVELQAHGHTKDRGTPTSFEQDADDVAALLKYLNIDNANFFGFSNGGNTAMQIAIRHTGIVDKLIIASSFYKRNGLLPGLFDGLQQASLDNMPGPLKKAYLEINNDSNALQIMHDRDKNRMLEFSDWSESQISSITAPTLLLTASQDVVTPEHAVEMSHKIPNAELAILPGTHGSYMGEICAVKEGSRMTEFCAGIVKEFLKSQR